MDVTIPMNEGSVGKMSQQPVVEGTPNSGWTKQDRDFQCVFHCMQHGSVSVNNPRRDSVSNNQGFCGWGPNVCLKAMKIRAQQGLIHRKGTGTRIHSIKKAMAT